jgi:uncharacterized membrane protein
MSIAQALSPPASASPRWLLLGSLALNLFFIGVAAALMIRSPAPPDRSISARIERLAATLPAADADKLRGQFKANRAAVESARDGYDATRETMRQALRREPFDIDAMRAAMSKTRTARQNFDLVLQSMIATAAAEMSPAGRNKLAEWPPGSQPQNSR